MFQFYVKIQRNITAVLFITTLIWASVRFLNFWGNSSILLLVALRERDRVLILEVLMVKNFWYLKIIGQIGQFSIVGAQFSDLLDKKFIEYIVSPKLFVIVDIVAIGLLSCNNCTLFKLFLTYPTCLLKRNATVVTTHTSHRVDSFALWSSSVRDVYPLR